MRSQILLFVMLAGIALLAPTSAPTAAVQQPAADPIPRPAAVPPPSPGAIDDAIERGVAFLIKVQNKEGSWGSPRNTTGMDVYAPGAGAHLAFEAAVTSLVIMTLIDLGTDSPEARKALERGEEWLLANLPKVRRATPDAIYNVWTHGYGIQALVRMHKRLPKDEERCRKIADMIREQYGWLTRYESVDGGWGYYDFRVGSQKPASDSTSFTTASILLAFAEAKSIGVPPPERLNKAAIDSLIRQQKADFSYLYGEYLKWRPMLGINRPGGSLGRSQACNLALRMWGDKKITDQVLIDWLDRLFARNLWLDIGRKRPIPHESYFQVAAYFFYYGHYYAALCIEQLPEAKRAFYQDQLAHVLLPLQEKEGSWWDFPFYDYHRQYGTAFALMALKRCRHADKPQ
jgi:hypothetical protein